MPLGETVPSSARSCRRRAARRAVLDPGEDLPADAVHQGHPGATRISGPRFGVAAGGARRGVDDAATPQATSASALTRSMSTWSMTAMSPGRSRPVRFFVRRSSRAVPPALSPTPGCAAAPHGADAHARHGPDAAWTRPERPTRIGDLAVTQRARHHGADDTPGGAGERVAPGRYRAVTSVEQVTGVAPSSDPTSRPPAVRRTGSPARRGPRPPRAVIRAAPRAADPAPRPARPCRPRKGRRAAPPACASSAGWRRATGSSTRRPSCSPSAASTR